MTIPTLKTSEEIEKFKKEFDSILDDVMFRVRLTKSLGTQELYSLYGTKFGGILIKILKQKDFISFTTDEKIYFNYKGKDYLIGKMNMFNVGDTIEYICNNHEYKVLRGPTLHHVIDSTNSHFYEIEHIGNTVFKGNVYIVDQSEIEGGKYTLIKKCDCNSAVE